MAQVRTTDPATPGRSPDRCPTPPGKITVKGLRLRSKRRGGRRAGAPLTVISVPAGQCRARGDGLQGGSCGGRGRRCRSRYGGVRCAGPGAGARWRAAAGRAVRLPALRQRAGLPPQLTGCPFALNGSGRARHSRRAAARPGATRAALCRRQLYRPVSAGQPGALDLYRKSSQASSAGLEVVTPPACRVRRDSGHLGWQ